MRVNIYKFQNDGSQKLVAVCRLVGGVAVCEGEEIIIGRLSEDGIPDYSAGAEGRLFPKDGIKFLENLKLAFRSPYLIATEVQEP